MATDRTAWRRSETAVAGDVDAFGVSLAPDDPARFLDINGDLEPLERWTLHDLELPGYAGALAVEGAVRTMRARVWSAVETRP